MKNKDNKVSLLVAILNHFESYICAGIMLFMTALLFTQVFTRYVLNHSLVWTEELSIMLFVCAIYLGIGSAVTEGKHLRIDVMINAVSPKARDVLLIISDFIFLGFCIYMIPPLLEVVESQVHSKSIILGIPMKWPYATVPIGMALASIRIIQSLYKRFKKMTQELGKVN